MHKEGLETYNASMKLLTLLFCISVRQDKVIEITIIELYLNVYHHTVITTYMTIKLQFPLY